MIFVSCITCGIVFAQNKKRHNDTLRSICNSLEIMQGEIRVRLAPIPEICSLLHERTCNEVSDFFYEIACSKEFLGSKSFEEIWKRAAMKCLNSLKQLELEELMSLGEILGTYGLSEQLSSIDTVIHALRGSLDASQQAYPGEKKLGLGLAASVAAAMVIILF